MSQFNSSISTVGIKESKVQQAILKLLENSINLNERLKTQVAALRESLRRQKVYFDAKIKELQTGGQ